VPRLRGEGEVMQEKQLRHVCDHCGKEVVLGAPFSDDPQPDGWYSVRAHCRVTDFTSNDNDDNVRVDLCPDCGPAVWNVIAKPSPVPA